MYGTAILIGEDTYRLARQAIEAREIDLAMVAGKTEPIRIFELLAPAGALAPGDEEWRGAFAEGLAAYREAEWDRAERQFQECLRLRPDDRPAKVFAQRIALLRASPPLPDWDGVWQMTEK